MKLVKPSANIIMSTKDMETFIERAGRVCYKSEGKITDSSFRGFIAGRVAQGHESIIEHGNATVRFIVDRGVSHELVRHRLASFSQESTRYCDYNKGVVEFVIPPWTNILSGEYDVPDDLERTAINPSHEEQYWFDSMLNAERSYKVLRQHGWTPQQARSVLPNSLKTEVIMTANMREWRHVFKMRTSMAAHEQMREVMDKLLGDMKRAWPSLFIDFI